MMQLDLHIQKLWDTLNGSRLTYVERRVFSPLLQTTEQEHVARPSRLASKKSAGGDKNDANDEIVQPIGKQHKKLKSSVLPGAIQKNKKSRLPPSVTKRLKAERSSKEIYVVGDGNCFFYALLATAPEIFVGVTHQDIRTILCAYLEDRKDETVHHDEVGTFTFDVLYSRNQDGANTYQARVNQLKRDYEYVDILMIYAAVNCYNIDIEVFDMATSEYTMHNCMTKSKRTVLLVRQAEPEHYWGTATISSVNTQKMTKKKKGVSPSRSVSPPVHMGPPVPEKKSRNSMQSSTARGRTSERDVSHHSFHTQRTSHSVKERDASPMPVLSARSQMHPSRSQQSRRHQSRSPVRSRRSRSPGHSVAHSRSKHSRRQSRSPVSSRSRSPGHSVSHNRSKHSRRQSRSPVRSRHRSRSPDCSYSNSSYGTPQNKERGGRHKRSSSTPQTPRERKRSERSRSWASPRESRSRSNRDYLWNRYTTMGAPGPYPFLSGFPPGAYMTGFPPGAYPSQPVFTPVGAPIPSQPGFTPVGAPVAYPSQPGVTPVFAPSEEQHAVNQLLLENLMQQERDRLVSAVDKSLANNSRISAIMRKNSNQDRPPG
jgi:hypothetical protein